MIETSHRSGWVAVGSGASVLSVRPLEEARRHARDLAPMLAELLAEQGWRARDLNGVIVSRGPGSYTGLRVGLMSAKTLAYAIGCPLLVVDTFAVIAAQTPGNVASVDVIADAQQDKIYVQRFRSWGRHSCLTDAAKADKNVCPAGTGEELRIVPFSSWLQTLPDDVKVSGPGLEIFAPRLPQEKLIAAEHWLPAPESLLRLGLDRLLRGERDDPFAVEPLYLRPSSAEEKWDKIPRS